MKDKKDIKKIVLAYSGGLDTSIIIPWLKENYNDPEIIAVSADVGQGDELDGLEEKAIKTGASKLYIADLTDEMVEEVIWPALKMGASYEQYLLGTAFARPIIAKKLVEIAKAEGADAICHGCTGKGNDQVRFELGIKRFAPDMTIIAPWREWDIKGRDEEIDYAEAHNVPLKISRETNYSKDKNLWHLSHEGLDLEDPANEPQYEKPGFLEMGVSPITAPDAPTYVTIDFEKGVPVAVDGEKMKGSDIIRKLNKLGGENGIGLLDIVENRLVGMKDRGVYETPGGTILYKAHQCLEMITVDKDSAHMKSKLAVDFADLIYNGKWFTPVREALSAFADKTQEHVTGSVKLKLYKGNMITASITSPESLYSEELVTFNESSYDQTNATGFINLWGLPDTVLALREQGKL
ncbi:argininosuccinate synthase [uncultured Dysosmobacter sp.]|uniref:argininosuccinate synthase n=1 Tax=uncultured Dysosmobacter sp. TaxID=2591384 RepID=UPI00261E267F|nr:argininosuccinate synthase [uncultured Dysosmobacter sp.]